MSAIETSASTSRSALIAKKRESRRPSRAGTPAGTAEPPARAEDPQGAALLRRLVTVARKASEAETITGTLQHLLTLGGELTFDDGLRALDRLDRVAVNTILQGQAHLVHEFEAGDAHFVSEIGLDEVGRLVVTTPLRRQLGAAARDLGVAARVAWSDTDIAEFADRVEHERKALSKEVDECRSYLSGMTQSERAEIIDQLRNALLSVPPIQLNRGRQVLSNLRGETNFTGKTLSPHSPQCFFTDLANLPLTLWNDDEVVVVACLWLSYRSGGAHRMESLNGAHIDLETVWNNLLAVSEEYHHAFFKVRLPQLPERRPGLPEVLEYANALNQARTELVAARALAHRIVGPTRAKREFAMPPFGRLSRQEATVLARLTKLIPGTGACGSLAEMVNVLRGNRWLLEPAGNEATGIESIIASVVDTAVEAFDADFALTRGVRDYPALVAALDSGDLTNVIRWELPAFYCCVIPSRELLGQSKLTLEQLTDIVWSMSARMQYNTWHVIPGNLPPGTLTQVRDFLAPQTLPDIAENMDYFHRGHVVGGVKHTLRSPERVMVAGHLFSSLTDLRLVRTRDVLFTPVELGAVIHIARFLADCLEELATFCLSGDGVCITSFDSPWHRERTLARGKNYDGNL